MKLLVPTLCVLLLSSAHGFVCHVSADSDSGHRRGNIVEGFEPTLAVVTGVLSIVFMLTFSILIYAKCCYSSQSDGRDLRGSLNRSSSRFSGIDKTVIESLPFFRFSSLRGSRQGLECAVCLSRFEDIEVLRLLPECKHAFHIACVDQWLERHATCPLCRHRVSNTADPSLFALSNSLRFLNQHEVREDSNLELYIEREERQEPRSGSFRPIFNLDREEDRHRGALHKVNHRIVVSDVVFRQRWSNVSSSDLMFLNSEMISSGSSQRFSCRERKECTPAESFEAGKEISRIKEEMEMKISFENKVSAMKRTENPVSCASSTAHPAEANARMLEPARRSVSDITAAPRFSALRAKNATDEASSSSSSHVKEERRRRLWLPIARRTAHWFANRERRSQQLEIHTAQNLDV